MLFDGETLDGWVQRGGKAVYEVKDGMIVGTTVAATPNSFLCTAKDYGDFVLELELKGDIGLNSGIMFRAQCSPEAYTDEGVDADGKSWQRGIAANRVHGYQMEIDHDKGRRWSGGVYDEARRGWLFKLGGDDKQSAREAFKFGDWNHYRIEARGDSLKTFVNGVLASDLVDSADAAGFIGLQVHSIYKPTDVGLQIRWRNIRIQELAAE